MHIFSKKSIGIVAILLFCIPGIAYADNERNNSVAVNLGWISIGVGIIANLSLVIFKIAKKIPIIVGSIGSVSNFAPFYKPVLDLHIMLNSIGFFAGIIHGIMLVRGLDYISLSLAIVMTFSMASGIVLRCTSGKNLKIFGRLAHGQFILAVLLVVLVVLHILTHVKF